MYVAVKGGERAIDNAHRFLAEERRGDPDVPEISATQISEQLKLAVDRVMTEGSLYDRELASLAIKQARGDQIEAVFLLRAYRTTLPRFGDSEPIDTGTMAIRRRISSTFKDVPGGQVLGPTFDYTHRLIDLDPESAPPAAPEGDPEETPPARVVALMNKEGLIETEKAEDDGSAPNDVTREPIEFPAERDTRLQQLARGDEGFLLALGYSTQRGYSRNHPFAGEIRHGDCTVSYTPPELGFPIEIGEIDVTECQMVTQFKGSDEAPPQFTQGYGLTFGFCERKSMAMALVDRALRAADFGEEVTAPAQDEEFVLAHCDNVQATGFVEHLKLPHYIDFQSELVLVRQLRREWAEAQDADGAEPGTVPAMAAE